MKVAHFANYGANQAGIYGTARDLILAEREVGIDAQMIDFGSKAYPKWHSRVGIKDGEITTISPEWAKSADILVRHSALPPEIVALNKPTVLALHGTPEYTVRLELAKKTSCLRDCVHSAVTATAIVTFWKEYLFEWETLLDKPIKYCPAIVDLDKWNPEGKVYDFGEGIHIVSTGMWRNEYRMPYECIWAAAEVVKEQSDVHLHVFACPVDDRPEAPIRRLMHQLKKHGLIDKAYGLVTNLPEIYRGADLALTPHVVASRTVREALACGCPIVAGCGNPYTNYAYTNNPDNRIEFKESIKKCIYDVRNNRKLRRGNARTTAETHFAPALAGERMKEIFEGIFN